MNFQVGVYLRVSTEDQSKIVNGSIECQFQRIKSYIDLKNIHEINWGKLTETYLDEGYSAKDTNRPAYRKMLADIRDKKINFILISDLSRLSRNISDFCKFMEELQRHHVKFLSIKEQFDSSTALGEMMIFNMINLAQFERKQTSERVAINYYTRSLKGLLNEGQKNFGYKRDSVNRSQILINEKESNLVQMIFNEYLLSSSLTETAKKLNNGSNISRVWNSSSIRKILINKAYLGLKEINKKYKSCSQDQLKTWQRYQIVKAIWPAIISQETFEHVQKKMRKNQSTQNRKNQTSKSRIYPLSGILKCSNCLARLVGQAAHGKSKAYRYYGHSKSANKTKKCAYKNIRSDKIEKHILSYLKCLINNETLLAKIAKVIYLNNQPTSVNEEGIKIFLKTKLQNHQKNWKADYSILKIFLNDFFKTIYCSNDCLKIYFSLDEINKLVGEKTNKEKPIVVKKKSKDTWGNNQLAGKFTRTSELSSLEVSNIIEDFEKCSSAFANGAFLIN